MRVAKPCIAQVICKDITDITLDDSSCWINMKCALGKVKNLMIHLNARDLDAHALKKHMKKDRRKHCRIFVEL